jgi:hypothetical protein
MDHPRRRSWRFQGLLVGLVVLLGLLRPLGALPGAQARREAADIQTAFAAAAAESGTPEALLLALSYTLTRWEQHAGAPSTSGGFGIMHLTDVAWQPPVNARGDDLPRAGSRTPMAQLHTLDLAAGLLGVAPATLKSDRTLNIRGGALLLASYARQKDGSLPATLAGWYAAVVRYSGFTAAGSAFDFADQVYATLASGASRVTSDGEAVTLPPQTFTLARPTPESLGLARAPEFEGDCPPDLDCDVVPAAYEMVTPGDTSDYGNYDLANRPVDGADIRYIIIHDTEISYDLTLQVFQNPQTYASSHYVIRSNDGHIAQMVENRHITWHAGNWYMNAHAIGLEHEGVAIEGASWYTEYMYLSSARLTRYLTAKYGIPRDRAHIIGHDEIPGPTPANQAGMHWDPGPFWDWDHYMDLVRGDPERPAPATAGVVRISPEFSSNMPPLTYCYTANDCHDVPAQPTNSVYLRTAPRLDAPFITNPYLTAPDLRANNWANKALAGQQFYRIGRYGAWDAIYFSGQVAWLYNPGQMYTSPASGLLVTPRAGQTIPVYGRAYPEAEAYPVGVAPQAIVPIYQMPASQIYVASELVQSSYYRAPTYTLSYEPELHYPILGQTNYYQLWFNHRFGFVKAGDVDVIGSPGLLGLRLDPAAAERSGAPGTLVTHTLQLTNTGELTATYALSVTGGLWPAVLSASTVQLGPGESRQITLQVSVPASPASSLDTAQIWVRRPDQPGQVALATRVTRTRSAQAYLPFISR